MINPLDPRLWAVIERLGPFVVLLVLGFLGLGFVVWVLIKHILKQSEINASERKEMANGFLRSLETTVRETTSTNESFRDEIKSLGSSVRDTVASIETVVSSMSRLCSMQSDCRETVEKIDVKMVRIEESLVRRPRRKVKNVKSPRGR